MFQYAFYLKMKHLGYACSLYFDESQQLHNGFELNRVFDLNITLVSKTEVDTLMDAPGRCLKIKRKLKGRHPSFSWEHDKGYYFKPEIFEQKKPVYLQGCWLSENYFKDIENEVRTAFKFKELDARNLEICKEIENAVSPVSIHMRKGDYSTSSIHLNVDYGAYISNAVSHINRNVTGPSYYVFSDDMQFAKEVLRKTGMASANIFFIDWNKRKNSYVDMQLMSMCKHNIIANSTFSWWGAWLNNFREKMVISPKEWFTVTEWNKNAIVPASWIAV